MTPAKKHRGMARYRVKRLGFGFNQSSFAEDARAGLSSRPLTLSPKYLYDELGSKLFDAICLLPEYYVTRTESQVLACCADEMVAALPSPLRLVELGSGSSVKTRYLIEALLRRQPELEYVPIDVSESAIESSSRELLHLFPSLHIHAYVADYFDALEALALGASESAAHTLVLFLGSTIGNLDPPAGIDLLRRVHQMLASQDALLLGADLKKSESVLVPAYDDALGVTAAFNLNLLVRINQELGGDADLRRFAHQARYNEEAGRMEMHLVSRQAQRLTIRALDLEVELAAGESIHTESSYKFDLDQLRQMGREAGFALERSWFDPQRWFSENLLVNR